MSSKTKTVSYYVEGPNWAQTVELDTEIFDTEACQIFEAGTRAIEQELKKSDDLDLGPFLLVKKTKKAKTELFVNTYICLNNSGHYKLAEELRSNYKKESGEDLAQDEQGYSKE